MSLLLTSLNISREDTISKHYRAATAQLKQIISHDPLTSKVTITAGCVSEDITKEIAFRFIAEGLNTIYINSGLFSNYHCLEVEIPLPESLDHSVKNEDVCDKCIDVSVNK